MPKKESIIDSWKEGGNFVAWTLFVWIERTDHCTIEEAKEIERLLPFVTIPRGQIETKKLLQTLLDAVRENKKES